MCWRECVVNPFKRKLEPVIAVDIVVTEPTVVTYPMLVDVFVETRLESVNTVGFIFYGDIATDTTS